MVREGAVVCGGKGMKKERRGLFAWTAPVYSDFNFLLARTVSMAALATS